MTLRLFAIEALTSNEAKAVTANAGEQRVYSLDEPADAETVTFTLRGNATVKMFGQVDVPATDSDYECQSTLSNGQTVCTMSTIKAATYYVMLESEAGYSDVSLTGAYTLYAPKYDPDFDYALTKGVVEVMEKGRDGELAYFKIEVPENAESLDVTLSAQSGLLNLYVKQGERPTTSVFDCQATSNSCSLSAPAAGTYYVMVEATADYALGNLTADYVVSEPETPTDRMKRAWQRAHCAKVVIAEIRKNVKPDDRYRVKASDYLS